MENYIEQRFHLLKLKFPTGGGLDVTYAEEADGIVNEKNVKCPESLSDVDKETVNKLKLHLLRDNYVGALAYGGEDIDMLPEHDHNLILSLLARTELSEVIIKGDDLDKMIIKGKMEGFNTQRKPIVTCELDTTWKEENMRCYIYANALGDIWADIKDIVENYLDENVNLKK